ncbi:cytochrome P450 [Streptomyces sp. NPDC006476]|uniref:cytochrome P450 n=1 Tax=Streptomyces sp. NPDC006476 TaxID=3157175 RepID=UPI0033AC3EF7
MGSLARDVLSARPIHDFERSVFKPIARSSVPPSFSSAVMRALTQDVKRALASDEASIRAGMEGVWPKAGYRYLHGLIYSGDLNFSNSLSRFPTGRSWMRRRSSANGYGSLLRDSESPSALAKMVAEVPEGEKGLAIVLYRRAVSALCSSASALLTNTLWLSSPLNPGVPIDNIVLESLRLLPPAWMLRRKASREYAEINDAINESDNVFIFPFLIHRNPEAWSSPEVFDPDRWYDIEDPDLLEDYLPFGYTNNRCWARHLILQLVKKVLQEASRIGLSAVEKQGKVKVPLNPLLSISSPKFRASLNQV